MTRGTKDCFGEQMMLPEVKWKLLVWGYVSDVSKYLTPDNR